MKANRSRLIQQTVADLGRQQTSDSGPPGEQHQADLAYWIVTNVKIVKMESEEPPEVEDQESFEAELRKELEDSYERLDVSENKRLRMEGQLRDSSVELADPFSPAVTYSMLGEDKEDKLSD